jgi:hypothetical protein
MAFETTTELQQEHQLKIKQVFEEVAKVVGGSGVYGETAYWLALFTNGHILLEGRTRVGKNANHQHCLPGFCIWILLEFSSHLICFLPIWLEP